VTVRGYLFAVGTFESDGTEHCEKVFSAAGIPGADDHAGVHHISQQGRIKDGIAEVILFHKAEMQWSGNMMHELTHRLH
ncbi:MAG: hypothetical protein Q4D59_10705, partial [Erysipelotrichaceae bacterium]|nr:hypothetical protein [Erysipelotrichaceae bacterium]